MLPKSPLFVALTGALSAVAAPSALVWSEEPCAKVSSLYQQTVKANGKNIMPVAKTYPILTTSSD